VRPAAYAFAVTAFSEYSPEVATVHLHLGDRETAMQWLRRGMEEQCDCMVWLKSEPWMDPLRVDPRYADLVKRVGFP
jgi:hypothetical protein